MDEYHVIKAGAAVMVVGIEVMTVFAAKRGSEEKDRQFVSRVSQGVLYKVEAGKIAAAKAKSVRVKKLGAMESSDNQNVTAKLKALADATDVPLEPELSEELSLRLDKLKSVPEEEFDQYYVADMKAIHAEDKDILEQEVQEGSDIYKPFASETAEVVREKLEQLRAM